MCDKPKQFPEIIPPPKTAEELLTLKQRQLTTLHELKARIVEMEDVEKKRITEYMGLIKDVMR
jgi:hypothetical protein